jgi:hypothetical protein
MLYADVSEHPVCSIFIGRYIYLPMTKEQTGCSEMSAYKIQTPGNYPGENIQHFLFSAHLSYNFDIEIICSSLPLNVLLFFDFMRKVKA